MEAYERILRALADWIVSFSTAWEGKRRSTEAYAGDQQRQAAGALALVLVRSPGRKPTARAGLSWKRG